MLYLIPLLLLLLMCMALSAAWAFLVPFVAYAYWWVGRFLYRLVTR